MFIASDRKDRQWVSGRTYEPFSPYKEINERVRGISSPLLARSIFEEAIASSHPRRRPSPQMTSRDESSQELTPYLTRNMRAAIGVTTGARICRAPKRSKSKCRRKDSPGCIVSFAAISARRAFAGKRAAESDCSRPIFQPGSGQPNGRRNIGRTRLTTACQQPGNPFSVMVFGVCPICERGEEEICFSNLLGRWCCLTCHQCAEAQAERAAARRNVSRLAGESRPRAQRQPLGRRPHRLRDLVRVSLPQHSKAVVRKAAPVRKAIRQP